MSRLARLVGSLFVIMVLLVGSGLLPGPSPAAGDDGPQEGVQLLPFTPPEKGGNPKLDSQLSQIVEAQATSRPQISTIEGQSRVPEGQVRVVVECAAGQADAAAQAAGEFGILEVRYENLLQMTVPVASLTALAALPVIKLVRLPQTPVLADVVSEGVGVINADDWQAAGYTGAGIKIGILDLGFYGYEDRLGTELPDASKVTAQTFIVGGDIHGPGYNEPHGTACAEIIHDIAPDAELYLVNYSTDAEMGPAVNWLIQHGVDIISHSAGFFLGGPGNGTGTVCNIVASAHSAGILWSQAAGNYAQSHWYGSWADTNSNGYLDFIPGPIELMAVYLYPEYPITVSLKWDDPWGASSNNYDVVLFNNPPTAWVDWSTGVQDGDDDPVEQFTYQTSTEGWYYIAVGSVHPNPPETFHLFCYPYSPEQPELRIASGSFFIPADSSSAMTVGAVAYSTPDTIESFSSQGPTDGGLTKPDLVAPDGVSCTSYPGPFYGTSAATPHAAGAAALVKQRYPYYTPAQIQAFLEGRAIDLGDSGKDNIYGSGRLYLGTPPLLDSIAVTPDGQTIAAGHTQQFTATGHYSDSSTEDLTPAVTWGSSDNTVAGINDAGLATGHAAGSANITATLDGISGNATLTVGGAVAENIYIEPRDPVITLDGGISPTLQFNAVAGYSDGSSENVTASWNSSATGVATIDASGMAQSVAAGTTVISATYNGVTGNTTLTVLGDTIAPLVRITSPVDGQVLGDTTANVTGRIDDASAAGELFINDVSLGAVGGDFNEEVTLDEGANVIRVSAEDSLGNCASDSVVVTVGTGRPAVTIASPETGSVTRDASLTVTGAISGNVTSASLVLNGVSHAFTVNEDGSFSQSITLAEGNNVLTVSAYPGGHAGESAYLGASGVRLVRLDTTHPVVTVDHPSSGQMIASPGCDLSGTVDDPGVSSVNVMLNGDPQSIPVSGGNFYKRLTLASGLNTITVEATDETGNSGNVSLPVTYDNSGPGVTITSPAANSFTSAASLNVTGTVSDASISSATLYLNGSTHTITVAAAGDHGQFNANITLAAGANTVEVRAGTGTSGNVTVTRDSTAPDVTLGLGEPGDSIAVTVISGEALSGAPSVSVNGTGLTMTLSGVDRWQGTYGSHTSPIPDGYYTVTASATDMAGNTASQTAAFSKRTLSIFVNETATITAGDVSLQVSTTAIVTNATVSVTRHFESPSGNAGNPGDAPEAAGVYVDIMASAALRNNLGQMYIQVGYDPDELPPNTDEASLKLYLWDIVTGAWQAVAGSSVNTTQDYIYGTVTHLSTFGGFGTELPAPPAVRPSGGGGGGGGGSPGLTFISDVIDAAGRITVNTVARSGDQRVRLDIRKGVTALSKAGPPLRSIRIKEFSPPPAPPEDSHIIGPAYDFEPNGATFNPAIAITFTYSPGALPEGVNKEDLSIAYYDTSTNGWVVLENIVVDPAANTVSGNLSHFTMFAVIAYPPRPAPPPPVPTSTPATPPVTTPAPKPSPTPTPAPTPGPAIFTISGLSVTPDRVTAGETATVTAVVTNTGDSPGSYTIVLKVNGASEARQDVSLGPGDSQTVSFPLTLTDEGSYALDVAGNAAQLVVTAPVTPSTPAPIKPAPAEPTMNWPLLAFIAGIIILCGVIIFVLFRRK